MEDFINNLKNKNNDNSKTIHHLIKNSKFYKLKPQLFIKSGILHDVNDDKNHYMNLVVNGFVSPDISEPLKYMILPGRKLLCRKWEYCINMDIVNTNNINQLMDDFIFNLIAESETGEHFLSYILNTVKVDYIDDFIVISIYIQTQINYYKF